MKGVVVKVYFLSMKTLGSSSSTGAGVGLIL